MGRGSPRAKLVLIGEAPGSKEAETGKPFMGAAGKLLTKQLLRLKFDIDRDIYITNVNKCRPPQNRTPTREEQRICTDLYLLEELAIIRPSVIVLLGATASKWAFPNGFLRNVENRHDELIPNASIACYPTWHPAYYLHSGDQSVLDQLFRCLSKAKAAWEEANEE